MSQAESRNSMIPSRRAVLAGIPAGLALASPIALVAAPAAALASEPDPIFAAIELHRADTIAFGHFLDLKGKFEEDHEFGHSPENDELERREGEGCGANCRLCEDMILTVPTTLAGILALLRYVEAEHARGNEILSDREFEQLVTTLAVAVDQIIARA
jgi:hypothetical protein